MLTNNAVYSNADAQISTSAAYTDAKDYLYMLTVEPSGVDYRDIYYYVVGDCRCFCVEVREYQAEADAAGGGTAEDTVTDRAGHCDEIYMEYGGII